MRVGETKRCDSGKTVTVLYREKLGEGVIRANVPMEFRVRVKWPTLRDTSSSLTVMATPPGGRSVDLVRDSIAPLGSHNDQFPYFKAGVYRQNGNTTPVSVDVVDLLRQAF